MSTAPCTRPYCGGSAACVSGVSIHAGSPDILSLAARLLEERDLWGRGCFLREGACTQEAPSVGGGGGWGGRAA